jgi:antitoxin VapB
MSLNIKNPRVHALAREAAERAGTTQTGALERALEEFLRALDARQEQGEQLHALLVDVRERVSQAETSLGTAASTHSGALLDAGVLYDEEGLPA